MSVLDNRAMGEYPISPGTSATIRELLVVPNPQHVKWDWLFNLRTLTRNLIESVPREQHHVIRTSELVQAVAREIQEFANVVQTELPDIRLRFYYPTYASMMRTYPHAAHKILKSEIQKIHAKLEKEALTQIASRYPFVEKIDCKLPAITNNAYITTHYPADLLTKNGFGELILVESYTGALKRKSEWSCKLTGSERPEVAALPFNKVTLQTFGDNSVQFASSPTKMKQILLDMAKSSKWNTLTPDERVIFGISQLRDPFARRFFRDMFR